MKAPSPCSYLMSNKHARRAARVSYHLVKCSRRRLLANKLLLHVALSLARFTSSYNEPGRHQNSLPLTTNLSQKLTQPSKGISYPVGDHCSDSQNRLCPLPIHYIVIRYPQQMVQMAFCDLLHTYHKQVANVSPACFCHPTVGNFDVSSKKSFLY